MFELKYSYEDSVPYTILITDYNMPGGMSGMELTKKVKARRYNKTKIYVLTGGVTESEKEEIIK